MPIPTNWAAEKADGHSVLSNAFGTSPNRLVRFRLLELLYQQEPELDEQTLHYSLDRAEEARAKLRDQVADRADPDAVAPHLGTFTNEALGRIVVELDDGTLTLDADEFKLELVPRVGEDGKVLAYKSVTTGLG